MWTLFAENCSCSKFLLSELFRDTAAIQFNFNYSKLLYKFILFSRGSTLVQLVPLKFVIYIFKFQFPYIFWQFGSIFILFVSEGCLMASNSSFNSPSSSHLQDLLYNTAWFFALTSSGLEKWSCTMHWHYDISIGTNEYYNFWKCEDFFMKDCGNMDQYVIKHKLSYLQIANSAKLLNKQKW